MSAEEITKLVKAIDAVRDPAVEKIADTHDKTFDAKRLKKEGISYAIKWGNKFLAPELKQTYKKAVGAGRNNAV